MAKSGVAALFVDKGPGTDWRSRDSGYDNAAASGEADLALMVSWNISGWPDLTLGQLLGRRREAVLW